MNLLRRYQTFVRFLLAYPGRFAVFSSMLLLSTVSDSIQPYFYKLFIESVSSGVAGSVMMVLLGYIFVRFISLFFSMMSWMTADWLVIPAAKDARLGAVKKIQDLDLAYHQTKSTGSLISCIRRGDGAFFSLFDASMHLVRIAVNFLIILIFFGTFNWQIAVMMFGSFAINAFLARFVILNNIQKRKVFNKSEDEISGLIVDNLLNYETVKYFAKEKWEISRLNQSFIGWVKSLWGYGMSFRVIDITVGSVGNIGLFFMLLYCLGQTASGKMAVSDFVMILGFISSFYPRFFEFIFSIRDMAKHYVDLDNYFAIFDQDTLVKDPASPRTIEHIEGEIEFRKVTFTYPEGKKGAVKDIDLTIRPGQSIALVGSSGVGKTTLVKLLMRFYDPTKGAIFIDGVDIKDMEKSYLRSLMGVVPQDPNLFNDTIAFNIGYANPNATKQEIAAAAKLAKLDEFIGSLPNKYDTIVGERGVKLSGGQRQRLAIARMIISNPNIIIFDEATSQLDSESEKYIQEGFWKATANKTTIIIAHRLSTVVKADKIIVMDKNRIKEVGSHQQLYNDKHSLYRHFWDLQTA